MDKALGHANSDLGRIIKRRRGKGRRARKHDSVTDLRLEFGYRYSSW